MKRLQNFNFHMILLVSLMAMPGCVPLVVGAAVGAGSVVYMNGALIENLEYSVEEVHQAALTAFKQMKMFVKDDELDKRSALIKAEYADGKEVKVFIDAMTEWVSKVTIRVGVLGDEVESFAILEAIRKNL